MFTKGIVVAALAIVLAVPAAAPAQAQESADPSDECDSQGGAGRPYRIGINCRVLEVDGHPRKFIVYVPDRRPVTGSQAPVVFMFHGSSGTAPQFLRISGWREQADATGLIAVFPQGLRYRILENGRLSTKWNDYTLASQVDLSERPRGYPESSPWPADDVGFVDAMVSDLRAELPIDRHRIYASGFSNGGAFTARLAVERSNRLAAAAFSGGGLHTPQSPARPIPMYLTLGSLDDRVLAQTGPPPLTELPLNPFALLGEPLIGSILRHSGRDARARQRRFRRHYAPALHLPALARDGHRPQRRPVPVLPARGARAQVRKRAQQPSRLRGGA